MKTGHFIDGRERGQEGPFFEVFDPSTREVMGHAARGETEDVDRAVRAARLAHARWWNLAPGERERILLRCADHLEEHGESLVDTLLRESGST